MGPFTKWPTSPHGSHSLYGLACRVLACRVLACRVLACRVLACRVLDWPAGFWPAGYWPAGYWPAGFWPAGYWPAGFVILNHTLHLVVPPPLTPPFPTRPAVCWRLAKVVLDVGSPAGAPPCPRGRAAACVCAPGCCRCVACYGHEVCCPARLKAHQRCLAEHIGKPDGGGSSSSS